MVFINTFMCLIVRTRWCILYQVGQLTMLRDISAIGKPAKSMGRDLRQNCGSKNTLQTIVVESLLPVFLKDATYDSVHK